MNTESTSQQHFRKRPRTESGDTIAQDARGFVQDETFWYDDGSIIVVAQGVGFCIYRGLLSSDSEVFRDMFSINQPDPRNLPTGEVINGCPVVHVTDTATEFRSLLFFLIRGRQYIHRLQYPFDDIINCIRLAHKYGIQDVLEDSVTELCQYFPTRLDKWKGRPSYSPRIKAISAVNIARLTDTHTILPAALYDCCQLTGDQLINGFKHPDGCMEALSPEDLARCVDGKARLCLQRVQADREHFPHVDAGVNCDECSGLTVWEVATERCLPEKDAKADVFEYMFDDEDLGNRIASVAPDLCDTCFDGIRTRRENRMQYIWNRLPQIFNLPDWPELAMVKCEHDGK